MPSRHLALRDLIFSIARQLPQSRAEAHEVLKSVAAMVDGDASSLFPQPAQIPRNEGAVLVLRSATLGRE